jgi:hypothetical protein
MSHMVESDAVHQRIDIATLVDFDFDRSGEAIRRLFSLEPLFSTVAVGISVSDSIAGLAPLGRSFLNRSHRVLLLPSELSAYRWTFKTAPVE